nr:hypothetical protein [Tanacetum cinerariifolium]
VTRPIDKKRIVITEEVVREILHMNDAEGAICLPNEEIFAGLARMGYEKPSTKLTFYKTNIADLSKHTTRYISFALTQKVFANMRRVGKGFSGVETPLFESMLVVRDVAEEAEAQVPAHGDDVQEPAAEEVVTDVVPPPPTPPSPPSLVIPSSPPHQLPCPPQPQDAEVPSLLFQQVLDTCSALARRVEDDMENVFNQGRIIANMDQDEGIELLADQEKDAEFEGRHADKQAKIYNIDLDHSSKVVATSTPIPAAKPRILNITAAPAVSIRRRQRVVIRDPEEELPSDTPVETSKVKDKGKGILIEAPKPMTKKDQIEMDVEYHEMKKKPQTESEARKNIILYLKNTEGYKMDFFKGMKYDEILPIFQAKFDANMKFLFKSREEMEEEDEEIIKSINETPAQKAAKRRELGPWQTATGKESSNPFMAGVNTPRSDEDSLKLMELMVFLLQRNVCVEIGINAARLSKLLLSGICDVTRLQALVDKKRIVITEEVVREILQLNDAEGQRFNFSNYIFESLVRNVSSSSKFYMYPRFIQLIIQTNIADLSKHTTRYISPTLTQKVFANMRRVGKGFSGVETPLFESMLVARDVVEEAEAQVSAQGNDVQEPVTEEVVADVVPPTSTLPSPPSPVIPSSPPHQPPCPPQLQNAKGSSLLFQYVLDTCSALALRVEGLKHDKAAQHLEIVKLKARVKKLEKINKVTSSKLIRLKKVGTSQRVESSDDMENVFNQGRIIANMDQDEGIELIADQEKDAEFEGRHADKQAKIYNIDLDHSSKVLSMQEDDTKDVAASTPILAAKPKILTITAAPAVSTRRRKGVVIRDPEEELSSDTLAETPKVKEKGKGILIEAPKPMKKKDQIEMNAESARKLMKKKPQTESEARKNMILYLKNTDGYKMEFFKGMKYDEILLIFQAKFDANIRFLFKSREEMEAEDEEIIKSINETPAQKAVKRRKLHEQAKEDEDLKKQLEVVNDEDDDVFIEATPIGKKVLVVDYEIVMINNKPRYKIIRADDTYQLYISFITLLKNFDREDLEDLWRIMKDRFSTSRPTNFFDDYL